MVDIKHTEIHETQFRSTSCLGSINVVVFKVGSLDNQHRQYGEPVKNADYLGPSKTN